MKDWKKILSGGGVVFSFVTAFFYAPIPLTTGNVTGARYIYNLKLDMDAKITNVNVASIKRDLQSLTETRADSRIQDYRFQMILYELQIDRLKRADDPDDESKVHRLERRIERLYDKIDEGGIERYDIRSKTNDMYIVQR